MLRVEPRGTAVERLGTVGAAKAELHSKLQLPTLNSGLKAQRARWMNAAAQAQQRIPGCDPLKVDTVCQ